MTNQLDGTWNSVSAEVPDLRVRTEFEVPTSKGVARIEAFADLPQEEAEEVAARIARLFVLLAGPVGDEK